ncbi:unnamed protein product [Sphagnum balticum]
MLADYGMERYVALEELTAHEMGEELVRKGVPESEAIENASEETGPSVEPISLLYYEQLQRFVWALVEDAEAAVKSRISALYAHPRGHLFSQLSDLLYFCEGYEINDQTGTQLSDDEVLLAPSSHLQALQCLVFKQVPKVG